MAVYTIQALLGPSNNVSEGNGLNSSGFVSGAGWVASTQAGVIWTPTGSVSVLATNPAGVYLNAISDGQQGGLYDAVGEHTAGGALLVRGGAIVDLAAVFGAGTEATDINNNGLISGYTKDNQAIVYDSIGQNVVAKFPPPTSHGSSGAMAINSSGAVAGMMENFDSGEFDGFFSVVPPVGPVVNLGSAVGVWDLNDAGYVVGQKDLSAVYWDPTKNYQPQIIPMLPGFDQQVAFAINNAGVIVGRAWTAQFVTHAFIYYPNEGALYDLNTLISDPRWVLLDGKDINDAGQISGTGVFNGQETGFLLTPSHARTLPTGGVQVIIPVLGLVLTVSGGVLVDAGGPVRGPGGQPVPPVPPWGWDILDEAQRDVLIGIAMDQLAKSVSDPGVRASVRSAILANLGASVGRLQRSAALDAQPATAGKAHVRPRLGKVERFRQWRGRKH
jgi:probable HAF family extracellular repeat protein